jgi:hypothetical protein
VQRAIQRLRGIGAILPRDMFLESKIWAKIIAVLSLL